MTIKQNQRTGRYELLINGNCYDSCISAKQVADDVYCHSTSCDEWNGLDCEVDNVPTDISEWEKYYN